jgi:hypothetical protein
MKGGYGHKDMTFLMVNSTFIPYITGMGWVIRHITIFNVLMNILKTEVRYLQIFYKHHNSLQ